MATKSSSKTTTTTTSSSSSSSRSKKGFSFGYILNLLSYIAIVVGGIALFIAMILSKVGAGSPGFISAMQTIANALAWIVVALLSFNFIKRRKKIWMWVVWAIALVMVIIGIILA